MPPLAAQTDEDGRKTQSEPLGSREIDEWYR